MEQRLNVMEKGQRAMKALNGLGAYLSKSPIDKTLLNLVYFRVSQINNCAFCLDMHAKDLREEGETEQRLYVMDAWRDAPFYSDKERAAFAWAEAVTKLTNGQVDEKVYQDARKQFSEEELVDLTLAVIAINGYNRMNIAFPNPDKVGSYHPGQFAVAAN